MKKTIVLLTVLLILSGSCFAQMYVQLGGGYGTSNRATAELGVGYNAGAVFVQGGYIQYLTRDVSGGTIVNARIGTRADLGGKWFAEPSAGYGFTFRSSDRPELNTSDIIGSLYAGKRINDGSLMLGGNYTNQSFIINLVIRYNF